MTRDFIEEILIVTVLLSVLGCVDSFRAIGSYRLQEDLAQEGTDIGGAVSAPDAGGFNAGDRIDDRIEHEEHEMEDPAALRALIAAKTGDTSGETTGVSPSSGDGGLSSPLGVPSARENLKLSPKQCLAKLERLGVSFVRPAFETPLIRTPVLFSAPIDGVRIGPRYRGNKRPTNAVMDCHLALALVEVARHAKRLGIESIEFYSIYRPLKAPPKRCPKGRGRKKCLKRKRKYKRTISAQKSQHRFGRAIDIRWFKTVDGRTLDVLEHFDRRSGTPPCSYTPEDDAAKLLSDFACGLYRYRIFNVMLTPNANKAHHNHFHFDLTPNANWHIIR